MKLASGNDIAQLVELMTEFYAESGYPLNAQRATEAFAGLLADTRLGSVWFIEWEGRNVGYVVLTFCYSMESGGRNAFIEDLFVRRAFRDAGLATSALTELRELCLRQGVRALHVMTGRDNAAAQSVYRRVGFVSVDHQVLTLKLASYLHES